MKFIKLITAILCLFCTHLQAQYFLKLSVAKNSLNAIDFRNSIVLGSEYSATNNNINSVLSHLAISAVKIKGNILLELELGPLQKSSYNISSFIKFDSADFKPLNLQAKHNAFAIKFGVSKIVMGDNIPKHLYLAAGGSLQYVNSNFNNLGLDSFSKTYAVSFKNNLINFNFEPQLYFNFNKKWSASLSFPLKFVSVGLIHANYGNPNLPVNQRNVSFSEFKLLPGDFVNMNIGVLYKIK
jgi:hypothetical protein